MPSVQLNLTWEIQLDEYITALAWAGDRLAIAAADGAVVLCDGGRSTALRKADGQSINTIATSADGQYLASGGQHGKVEIWTIATATLVQTLEYPRSWIDKLIWHPVKNHLAFSIGKQILVWDVAGDQAIAALHLSGSSAMDLTWHPQGKALAVGGYLGTKIWRSDDWSMPPEILAVPSASVKIGWSNDGKYFASGNLDRMITLVEAEHLANPWIMRGFPGKIRGLDWSDRQLLAVSSQAGIAVWQFLAEQENWDSQLLTHHHQAVQALAFQPGSDILASVAGDGLLGLAQHGNLIHQQALGATGVCLAWNISGQQLAIGMQDGTIVGFQVDVAS